MINFSPKKKKKLKHVKYFNNYRHKILLKKSYELVYNFYVTSKKRMEDKPKSKEKTKPN